MSRRLREKYGLDTSSFTYNPAVAIGEEQRQG